MASFRCQIFVFLFLQGISFVDADVKFLGNAEEDPGDLADAELEKIQVAEDLDADKTGATTSDSEPTDDEITSDTEASIGEDDAESFLQEGADQSEETEEEDPGDLADGELEKV